MAGIRQNGGASRPAISWCIVGGHSAPASGSAAPHHGDRLGYCFCADSPQHFLKSRAMPSSPPNCRAAPGIPAPSTAAHPAACWPRWRTAPWRMSRVGRWFASPSNSCGRFPWHRCARWSNRNRAGRCGACAWSCPIEGVPVVYGTAVYIRERALDLQSSPRSPSLPRPMRAARPSSSGHAAADLVPLHRHGEPRGDRHGHGPRPCRRMVPPGGAAGGRLASHAQQPARSLQRTSAMASAGPCRWIASRLRMPT